MAKSEMETVREACEANPNMKPEELESLANLLMAGTLKDRSRTKAKTEEYPVLSERQFQRRLQREIPFSALPKGVKVVFGLSTQDDQEG